MEQALTRSSRLLALSGGASVVFGIAALVWPSITLIALVLLFGAFALVSGVLTIVAGLDLATEHARHWAPLVFSGLFGTAIGVFTFFKPGITGLALVYLIALWAIVTGVLEFAAGIEFTGQVKGAWALSLGGILSVAFGVLIALWPVSGALAIVWLIGTYAIVFGIVEMYFAYRIHAGKEAIRAEIRKFEQPTPAPTR